MGVTRGGVEDGAGRAEVADGETDGDGVPDGEADGETDGVTEGDADGEADRDGDGETGGETDGDAMTTRGIDGRTTVGWRPASAGPTARTATQTTSTTRTAAVKQKMRRAGPNERMCLAGNGRFPLQINRTGPGTIPVSPCLWHGGPELY